MTDSTPQYQRATQEDIRWLEEASREGWKFVAGPRAERILNSLRATPAVPDRQTRFTNEHAKGLGAVMDKLQKANGPVVLSWEEADAVLDFAEAALAMEAAVPAVPDREALARALFAGCLDEEPTADRLDRLWLEITREDERNAWRRQADRLVRVLGGGFPAVLEREVTLEDTDGEMLEQSGVEDGDTIRPPATNNDVAWLTRAYRTEGQRQSALRILTALVDTPPPAVLEQEPIRWIIRDLDGSERTRKTRPDALDMEMYARNGETVMALYAAPQVDTQTT